MNGTISASMTAAKMQRGNINDFWAEAILDVARALRKTDAQLAAMAAEAFPEYTHKIALQVYVSQFYVGAISSADAKKLDTRDPSLVDDE